MPLLTRSHLALTFPARSVVVLPCESRLSSVALTFSPAERLPRKGREPPGGTPNRKSVSPSDLAYTNERS